LGLKETVFYGLGCICNSYDLGNDILATSALLSATMAQTAPNISRFGCFFQGNKVGRGE